MPTRPPLSGGKTWILIGLIGLFAIWYYAGPCARRPDREAARPPDFAMDAVELMRAYEANQIAADIEYRGKTVLLYGTIKSVGKDIMDQIYVTYDVGNAITTVQCFFSDKYARQIAATQPGQQIQIRGKVAKKLINVLVEDCIPIK